MSSADQRRELYNLVVGFIVDNEITSPDALYRSDQTIESFYSFIEDVCDLVGYAEADAEEDEDNEDV
jgi:hypothetical protein